MSTPLERTTKIVTTVDSLSAAWSFVMTHIDTVGPEPSVSIRPIRSISIAEMVDGLEGRDTGEWQTQFEVAVEGMIEVPA